MRKTTRIMLMIGCGFAIALMAVFCLYLILVELAVINNTMLGQFMTGRMGKPFFTSVKGVGDDALKQAKPIVWILVLVFNALLAFSIWTFIVPFSSLHNLASKKHMILNIVVGVTGNIFCLIGGILGLISMNQNKLAGGEEAGE